jgi:hypothetical protein
MIVKNGTRLTSGTLSDARTADAAGSRTKRAPIISKAHMMRIAMTI